MTTRLTLPLFVALFTAILTVALVVASPQDEKTVRLSVSAGGEEANDTSAMADVTADGRYVVYQSIATNLIPGDINASSDIFVLDLVEGSIERVSVASDGTEANGASQNAAISGDGRYVVFESLATNLDPRDTLSGSDIFLRDRETGSTTLISVNERTDDNSLGSFAPDISEDGSTIVFHSNASGLVPDDTNGVADIFAYYPVTNLMTCITSCAGSDGDSTHPAVNGNGNVIVFESEATNLIPNDTNGLMDVFIWAPGWGHMQRVSESLAGEEANDISYDPAVSRTGRQIAFTSRANNLVVGDTNDGCVQDDGNCEDVFVRDVYVTFQDLARVSVGIGAEANGSSFDADLSADGDWVIFRSSATNLIEKDSNLRDDVFVFDRVNQTTIPVSLSMDGTQGNRNSYQGALGLSGGFAFFTSLSTNLVADDTNTVADIFLREFETSPGATATPTLATAVATLTPTVAPTTVVTTTPTVAPSPTLPPPPATSTPTPTPELDMSLFLPVIRERVWCVPEEVEPNNGYVNATPIGACKDTPISGMFPPDDTSDNQDVYKLTLIGPGQLVIDLTNIPAGNNYELVLYGEGGQNHPTLAESRNGGNTPEQLRYTLPPVSGVYYVQVFRVLGFSDTPYTLRWKVQ